MSCFAFYNLTVDLSTDLPITHPLEIRFTCHSRENCLIFIYAAGYCTDNSKSRRGPHVSFRGHVTVPGRAHASATRPGPRGE
jgi:hypothetical protein